ncbi:unnamed protein product [Lathyrus oleraceus]
MGKEHALVISNHESDIDWLVGWTIVERSGCLGSTLAEMKKSSKFLPVIGWSMRFSAELALHRPNYKPLRNMQIPQNSHNKVVITEPLNHTLQPNRARIRSRIQRSKLYSLTTVVQCQIECGHLRLSTFLPQLLQGLRLLFRLEYIVNESTSRIKELTHGLSWRTTILCRLRIKDLCF